MGEERKMYTRFPRESQKEKVHLEEQGVGGWDQNVS
jgi:hypothetical protein